MLKLKKGDIVEVITGKEKGKKAEILSVFPGTSKVIVKGLNLVVKHNKSNSSGVKGERIKQESPLHISNVMLVCPEMGVRTRVGFSFDGEKKIRVSKKSGNKIS